MRPPEPRTPPAVARTPAAAPTPAAPPRPTPPLPAGTASTSMIQALQGDHLVLMPGQLSFGARAASMRTLLGSCVAITLWHPQRRLGGMCHYLLPSRRRTAGAELEGRFGDEALELMVGALRRTGCRPEEFEAHLYGGADTMPDTAGVKFNIGERNIEIGWELIDRYGFTLQGVDVGDHVPRTVHLQLANGQVDMRRGASRLPPE